MWSRHPIFHLKLQTPMIELTDNPIDANRVLARVSDPECGAEVIFVGTTRQWTEWQQDANSPARRVETSHLVYESYREMALAQMSRLEEDARRRWPVRQVIMVHRLGHVPANEASVAIAVSSPHRSEAFEAARWLIDELKHHVPIWKQEHYVQHGPQWIHPTAGSCRCDHPAPPQTTSHAQSQTVSNPTTLSQGLPGHG